jgi:hypothetical protein
MATRGGQAHGVIPARGVTTAFSLLEKARGAAFARHASNASFDVFDLAPGSNAACATAAEASACDALVTRDPDGYPNPPLPVIDPAAALGWLSQE